MIQKVRTRIWFAGFTNGERKTKWYRSRDKAWKAAKAAKCTHVNSQGFRELMAAPVLEPGEEAP